MSHPFSHPKGREIIKRVAQSFHDLQVFISRDSNIVFVCGGPTDRPCMRSRFIEYASQNLTHLRIFLAENAQKDLISHHEPEFYNVAVFEELIAEISDCIILFPESPGSFSELGYFARSDSIKKKLLVVNDANLQGQDSFVALGPIEAIDRASRFRPTIQIEYSQNPSFDLVQQRLNRFISSERRQRFESQKHADLSAAEKFFFVFEILRLFRTLQLDGITYVYRSVFGNVSPNEIKQILSILIAANYVDRYASDPQYLFVDSGAKPFLENTGLDIEELRLEITDFYERDFPNIAHVVKGIAQ